MLPPGMRAQAPVPTTFQDLYTELDNYLVNFNATLTPPNGPAYPTLMTGSLKSANGNIGPQLLNALSGNTLLPTSGVQLQINELKAMGAQAVMVEMGFPVLYDPFLTSVSQSTASFTAYYQAVATAVRAAGMKLIIENDTLLTNDVQSGWDVAPFYATLNWTQYQQARAQMAVTIAQTIQPDYLVLLEEPTTEANDSLQTNANTPSGSYSLLSTMLTAVQAANVPGVKYGAGTGTAQVNALSYIQQYVTLPVDFIDMHIYPINDSYLPIALQIASTAAAAGKPVSMTECWMWKIRDTEINVLTNDEVRARDPFSFWAPLDALFIQTMQNLANTTQMLFLDPFGEEYYYAYLNYDDTTDNLTPSQILAEENTAVQFANQTGEFTSTGLSYYSSMVVPADTIAPAAPTNVTGSSGNPTSAVLNWNAATDNIGVAGYSISRNGTPIVCNAAAITDGMLYCQDSGLSEATTYTYTVQAYDVGGNMSVPSTPVTVTTTDVTPPTAPSGVAVSAVACTRATLTWKASQDNTGISAYLLWMGLSPDSLTQVATASGTTLQYSNSTLSPATTYYFGVEAQDKNRNVSYMSSVVSVTTPALPVAPSNVLATPNSETKITLSWSASTGGLAIAHYNVYRGTSPTSLALLGMANGTTYPDTTVVASTTYYYAVQAADKGNPPAQSAYSATVPGTTFGPPSVPANLAASPISCTKVGLTWSPAISGGLKIANYRVYKGTSPTALTQLAITTATSYTDVNDLAQTTYYYAIQSADTGAPPDLSAISNPVAVTTYAYPGAPQNLTAIPVSASKITLTWSPAVSGGLKISNYHVYGGTSPSSLTQLAVTTNTTYTNSSLKPGTTYYYQVQAVDSANDDSPLTVAASATTFLLPTAPTNVTAVASSSSQIVVTWLPSVGSLPIGHYNVLRGSTPNNLAQIGTTTKTTYTDRSLSAGTTYYYSIQGDDTGLDLSPESTPVAGTTLP